MKVYWCDGCELPSLLKRGQPPKCNMCRSKLSGPIGDASQDLLQRALRCYVSRSLNHDLKSLRVSMEESS